VASVFESGDKVETSIYNENIGAILFTFRYSFYALNQASGYLSGPGLFESGWLVLS